MDRGTILNLLFDFDFLRQGLHVGLKLITYTKLASDLKRSSSLHLSTAGTMGMNHYTAESSF